MHRGVRVSRPEPVSEFRPRGHLRSHARGHGIRNVVVRDAGDLGLEFADIAGPVLRVGLAGIAADEPDVVDGVGNSLGITADMRAFASALVQVLRMRHSAEHLQ